MRKLLAAVLAASMVASMGITTFAREQILDYTAVVNANLVNGSGNAIADGDTYRTGDDIYGIIGDYSDYSYLLDEDLSRVKFKKVEGAKAIGSPKLTTKTMKGVRKVVLQFPIIEAWDDKETKVEVELEVTAREDLFAGVVSNDVFPQYTDVAANRGNVTTAAVTKAYKGLSASADQTTIDGAVTTFLGLVDDRDTTKNLLVTATNVNKNGKGLVFKVSNASTVTVSSDGTLSDADFATATGKTYDGVFEADGTTVVTTNAAALIAGLNGYVTARTNYETDVTELEAGILAFDGDVPAAVSEVFTTEAQIVAWAKEIAKVNAAATPGNTYDLLDGDKLVVPVKFWVKNFKIEDEDITRIAGEKGVVVKPVKNEENIAEWEDNNETLARLTFDADSSTSIYFPKLSTKWDNIYYAEKFDDQDAFVREFVSNPSISSTSRAVLELMVPYVNEDDELTVDEADIIVYLQLEDGELEDVTSKGTIGYNDADELVFTMKTRQLGTYIFAEMPVDAVEDEPVDEPVEEDVTTGGKENPGTGA